MEENFDTIIDDRFTIVNTNNKDYKFKTIDNTKNKDYYEVSSNRDYQILLTLWYKYLWTNNRFADYASKILWINL